MARGRMVPRVYEPNMKCPDTPVPKGLFSLDSKVVTEVAIELFSVIDSTASDERCCRCDRTDSLLLRRMVRATGPRS